MKYGDWNIVYRDKEGQVTERLVTVIRYVHGATPMLVAWCHLRNDERSFVLSRILSWKSAGGRESNFDAAPLAASTPKSAPAVAYSSGSLAELEAVIRAVAPQSPVVAPARKPARTPWFSILVTMAVGSYLVLKFAPGLLDGERHASSSSATAVSYHYTPTPSPNPTPAPKPSPSPKPAPRPAPKPIPAPAPDTSEESRLVASVTGANLASWSDAKLDAAFTRLLDFSTRRTLAWADESLRIGYDYSKPSVMAAYDAAWERMHEAGAGTDAALSAVISEQANRIMAKYNSNYSDYSNYEPSTVALVKPHVDEVEKDPARTARDVVFKKATGNSSGTVLNLYASGDENGDGSLDWGEIQHFQTRLYAAYRYKSNDTALSPDQFVARGGGDCEDWAIMTVGFLQYWGFTAYVGVLDNPRNSNDAHAIALVPVDAVPQGFMSYRIAGMTEYHGMYALPDGNYVPIDYNCVGHLSGATDGTWKLSCVANATKIYGEGW